MNMEFFSKNKEQQSPDVKSIRDGLLYAIRQQLSLVEGGEGGNIRSLLIYFYCTPSSRPLYEAAVYADEPDRFKKTEVQKIADDYAINLPANWKLEMAFVDNLPEEAIPVEGLEAGLYISTDKKGRAPSGVASLVVLQGEAEKQEYQLKQQPGRINIGRDSKVKTKDGFFRTNDIAFPASSTNEGNRFVSSQHAHVEYDAASGRFLLFADEGGLPPNNKIKVRGRDETVSTKLQSREIPHVLQHGDMIILGESAMLEFKIEES